MPDSKRAKAADHFALTLDGVKVGGVKSAAGGSIYADVVSLWDISSSFADKHLGMTKYEDITLQVGLSNGQPLYDWLAAVLQAKPQHKNGSVIAYDAAFKPVTERQFSNALISEITFPKLDVASKNAADFTIKITPESIQQKAATGISKPPATKEKLWHAANFRLNIDGLDTKSVSEIDAFSVKQDILQVHSGDGSGTHISPARLEFPNLAITLSEKNAQTWHSWFESFVIQGNNSSADEKNGSLVYLAANRKTELARINLFNMGIFKLAPDKTASGSENIQRVKAELYVERMEIVFGGSKP